MFQPGKWVWGLLPLGLLWFSANQFFRVEAVDNDLTAKAVAAAIGVANSAPGLKTIGIDVRGRDVTLSGETLDAGSVAKARAAVEREFGVRRVTGDLTVAVMKKPYVWAATRAGDKITLSGYVPDEKVKKDNAEAAAKAFPGAVVVDQQAVAFGAPLGFATMAGAAIPELSRLSQGRFSLDETRFCVEGEASTPDNYLDLGTKMKAMPQTAFTLANCALKPPVVTPYVWGAEKTGPAAVSLTGFVPSDEMRKQIADAARAAFPSASITDLMKPALGAPAGLAALAATGLGDLSRLISGKIALSGASLSLTGQGPTDYAACTALKAAASTRTAAASVDGIACPPAPAAAAAPAQPAVSAAVPATPPAAGLEKPDVAPGPYGFELQLDRSGAVITGYVPDNTIKSEIIAMLETGGLKGRIRDELRIAPGAPANFAAAAKAAARSIQRLDIGTARLSDQTVAIQGLTCRDLIKGEVENSALVGQPQGYAGRADVGLRQTGCLIDASNVCQADLDIMTRRNAILFQQGKAELALAPDTEKAIGEVVVILQKCPDATVRIEGHTNRDGEEQGFDNQALSQDRAAAVLAELARLGITAGRMSASGYGSANPLLPHDTDEGREKNRRVQFTVTKP